VSILFWGIYIVVKPEYRRLLWLFIVSQRRMEIIKVKVKSSLCSEYHAVKAYWGIEGMAPHILSLAVDGGEWSASRPGCFTPGKRAPVIHRIGSLVDLRAGLDTVVKRKFPTL
jgi:hypothetical protein